MRHLHSPFFKIFFPALLTVLALSACGKKSELQKQKQQSQEKSHAEPKIGELFKRAKELADSDNRESCDKTTNAIMMELVKVLDEKADEINKYIASKGEGDTESKNLIPFGPSYLVKLEKEKGEDRWQSFATSWQEAHSIYQKVKDEKLNEDWMFLIQRTKSMLLKDSWRIINRSNLYLDHNSEEKIASLKSKIDACVNIASCIAPEFSAEDLTFMSGNYYFNYFKDNLEKEKNREALKDLQKRVDGDYKSYGFVKEASIQAKKESEKTILELPLDSGKLSEKEQQFLTELIEPVWTSAAMSLKIIWTTVKNNIYKVLFFENEPGERAWVGHENKTVNLYPLTEAIAIPHEIGHVLGFLDKYYTVWDDKKCEYNTEINTADLMSYHYSGDVTADEWKKLQEQYPVSAAVPAPQ